MDVSWAMVVPSCRAAVSLLAASDARSTCCYRLSLLNMTRLASLEHTGPETHGLREDVTGLEVGYELGASHYSGQGGCAIIMSSDQGSKCHDK